MLKAPTHPLNLDAGWISNPDLTAILTGTSSRKDVAIEDAIDAAEERLKIMTLRQRTVANLRAGLKVAGATRVTMNPHNRAWRDSQGGKAQQKRVLAAAGA